MQPPARPTSLHWPTLGQFIFSALAMLGCWSLAAASLVGGVYAQFGASGPADGQTTALWLRAAGLGLAGFLLIPSTLFSFLRLQGRPVGNWARAPIWRRLPWLLLPVWPLALLAGYWVSTNLSDLAWLLLPPLYLLGVGIPVWWLAAVGWRGISAGSPQRTWGIFAAGLVLGPGVVIVIELLAVLLLATGAAVLIGLNPQWQTELSRMAQRIVNAQGDIETITRILRPYLMQPAVLYLGLGSIAGLVPLIEEALKPLGLYFLAGRRLTPAEGFVGGLLSGAGFALFESLNMSSALPAGSWAAGTLARAGTDLVHILATGLVGWGLASAWTQRRYLRLGAAYLLAVSIHGLWNAISVTSAIVPMAQNAPGLPQWIDRAAIAPLALGVLVVAMFLVLLRANQLLRREQAQTLTDASVEALPSAANH